MIRHFGWIIVVVAFAALAPGAASGIEDRRPNVIVILADDRGPGDLSCYGGSIPTPHIDRMAKEGVRFTRYYSAAPICSPSRCGLITGQFPARWRITSYLQTKELNSSDNDPKKQNEARERYQKLYAQRSEFMNEDMTDFVWLYLRK